MQDYADTIAAARELHESELAAPIVIGPLVGPIEPEAPAPRVAAVCMVGAQSSSHLALAIAIARAAR